MRYEVVTFDNDGNRLDTAEADSKEAALFAASVLIADASPNYYSGVTANIYLDGQMIASGRRRES